MAPYRVLVVDDSAFMRAIISDLILADKQFTIAATASNGMEAIAAVREHQPDVITMDLEMPQMNGIEALQLIMKESPRPIIMLSGISEDNTRDTIKALQFGAFDFIRKPSAIGSDDIHAVGEQLLEKLRTAAYVKTSKEMLAQRKDVPRRTETPLPNGGQPGESQNRPHVPTAATPSMQAASSQDAALHKQRLKPLTGTARKETAAAGKGKPVPESSALRRSAPPEPRPLKTKAAVELEAKPSRSSPEAKPATKIALPADEARPAISRRLAGAQTLENKTARSAAPSPNAAPTSQKLEGTYRHLVAIGTSTGGPRALHEVICSLPPDFPAPVLVVQHMPPKFTKSLAQRLDTFSNLKVFEAEQGMEVKAGAVYVAPGGHHMELAKHNGGFVIQLGEQPQRNGHRPSVDVMFESLAPYSELSIHAVIMTGMGSDGAKGMKLLAEQGAVSLIAESEETCIVYGMPRCAVEGGFVKDVLPLGQIASQLVKAVTK